MTQVDVIPELVRIPIECNVFRYDDKHYMSEEFESGELWWWVFNPVHGRYERVKGKGTIDLLTDAYKQWKGQWLKNHTNSQKNPSTTRSKRSMM